MLAIAPGVCVQASESLVLWANNGEDKVPREELRASKDGRDVRNSVWNGTTILMFGARNETVSANVILEAPTEAIGGLSVSLDSLVGPGGAVIESRDATAADLFDYRNRNIELFYVRYLKIKGCSNLAYEHYDERHVPERFRRPFDKNGNASGTWKDRPDHDKSYPDIAVPLELHPTFDVAAGTSQSIWVDIYIPTDAAPGEYRGTVTVSGDAMTARQVPIRLRVLPFALPDMPTCKTMLYVSPGDINERYEGMPWLDEATVEVVRHSRSVMDRHFQMAHRHRISLITDDTPLDQMDRTWQSRLDGSLFTASNEYDGPGVGVGNNVYSIGTYGTWPWKNGGKNAMHNNATQWVEYFDSKDFETPTDYFLYLIDESHEYETIEQWCAWLLSTPGSGKRLKTLATMPAPAAMKNVPSLTLPCSTLSMGIQRDWDAAVADYLQSPEKDFYLYNGQRPGSGCLITEDDGVAMRTLPWCQFKFGASRWFIWSGTYYNNFQGGTGQTRLFRDAHTFGGKTGIHPTMGETGGNYNNGDGVLFYPGTDKVYADESYGIDGPIASLRMKHWRRGIQDYEYLTLASKIDGPATRKIVQQTIPRVLWEVTVDDESDPTWARTGISWSTNPDDWERARVELVKIILRKKQTPAEESATP